MKKFFLLIFSCSILYSQYSFSQTKKLDSLWLVYNNKNFPDSNRLKALQAIAWSLASNNPDTAIILAEEEIILARKAKQIIFEGKALNTIGVSHINKGNYPKALMYHLQALKIRETIYDKKGMGSSYTNIGLVYAAQSEYPKALEYYFKSLKIHEEIGERQGIASCYLNIGAAYQEQKNRKKTFEYCFKALKLYEEMGDKKGIGSCYGNIGVVYRDMQDYSNSLEYSLKAVKITEEVNDMQGMEIGYINIGELYSDLADFERAIHYSKLALKISEELGDINVERTSYENLADIYFKTGRFKEAYENHVKFKQLTDSIFNTENSKQLGDMKTQFEVEKKEAELKIKAEAQEAISAEEKKKQQIIIYAVAGVLLLVIVFSLFLFNRFRITQKQKKIIEEQKILVDKAYENLHEKNKEVMDSIYYARRIQRALITSEKYIAGRLNRLMKN